ncbi:MAG: hypothetical protein ACREM1_22250 [Longimicrobiales bacterium]
MATTQSSSPTRRDSTSNQRGRTAPPSSWLGSTSSRLLLESALIVLSVLIGFALSEWGSRRADHARAAEAVENFRLEIQDNLTALDNLYPKHVWLAERLADAIDSGTLEGETGFDVFAALHAEGQVEPTNLREAAWQTAVSTGVLRLLDYDVAALLSETYLIQETIMTTTIQLMSDRLSDESNFDPQARDVMIRVWHRLVSDLAGQEKALVERYQLTLQELPAPARR